jgi:hypothetical protein
MEKIKRYIISIPIFLIVYLFIICLAIYPHIPIDYIGWIILIFIGIPIMIFVELIGTYVFNEKISNKLSRNKFSLKRIIYALNIGLLIIIISLIIWIKFNNIIIEHFK